VTTYILIFFASLGIAFIGTPLVRRMAVTLGVVDLPGGRKIHTSPIPLLGGAAVYVAFLTGWLLFGREETAAGLFSQVAGIVGGATIVALVGLWDDSRGKRLGPLVKFGGQLLAASALILGGIHIEVLRYPALNILGTLIWVVGITNAINFLDNMDGLSTGVSAVAAAFFFLLATTNGQYLVASLSAAILGATLGFLPYNFAFTQPRRPATIFIGDTGALFLGFLLAAIGIKLRFENTDIVTWMIPVLVMGLPIFDMTLVVLSRIRRRIPPYRAGRDHFSHRLVRLGLTRREAVLTLYLVAIAFGMFSLFLLKASIVEGYFTGVVIAIGALLMLVRLEQIPADTPISETPVDVTPAREGTGR